MINIAILGLGAIGKLIYSSLSAVHTLNISYIDERPSHLNQKRSFIFSNKLNGKEYEVKPSYCSNLSDQQLVILCTKTYQSMNALASINGKIRPEIPIVILQNGMGNEQILQQSVPNPYILATTDCGAYVKNNKLCVTAIGTVTYDSLNICGLNLNSLSGIVPWEPTDNINEAIFKKLAVNSVINPITAIYDLKNGEILQQRELCENLIKEIYTISKLNNFNFTRDYLRDIVYGVAKSTRENYSSMHEDLKYGRRTEIDSIVGYLLNQAKKYNISLPNLESVYKIIKANILKE